MGFGNSAYPSSRTADNLSDLQDVNITNPTNGQVLAYSNGVWVNLTESGLGNVTTSDTLTANKVVLGNNGVDVVVSDNLNVTNSAVDFVAGSGLSAFLNISSDDDSWVLGLSIDTNGAANLFSDNSLFIEATSTFLDLQAATTGSFAANSQLQLSSSTSEVDITGFSGVVTGNSSGGDSTPSLRVQSVGANGGAFRFHVGDRTPESAVAGFPGDFYVLEDGTNSSLYQNHSAGPGSSTTGWVNIGKSNGNVTTADTLTANAMIIGNGTEDVNARDSITSASEGVLSITARTAIDIDKIEFVDQAATEQMRLEFNHDSEAFLAQCLNGSIALFSDAQTTITSDTNDIFLDADQKVELLGSTSHLFRISIDSEPVIQLESTGAEGETVGIWSVDEFPIGVISGAPGDFAFVNDSTNSSIWVGTGELNDEWRPALLGSSTLNNTDGALCFADGTNTLKTDFEQTLIASSGELKILADGGSNIGSLRLNTAADGVGGLIQFNQTTSETDITGVAGKLRLFSATQTTAIEANSIFTVGTGITNSESALQVSLSGASIARGIAIGGPDYPYIDLCAAGQGDAVLFMDCYTDSSGNFLSSNPSSNAYLYKEDVGPNDTLAFWYDKGIALGAAVGQSDYIWQFDFPNETLSFLSNNWKMKDAIEYPDESTQSVASTQSGFDFDIRTIKRVSSYNPSVSNKRGIQFHPRGRSFYICNSTGITQFDMTIPWDITTASVVGSVFNPAELGEVQSAVFRPDGGSMILFSSTGDLHQYTITDFNIAGASATGSTLAVGGGIAQAYMHPNGLKLYILREDTDVVGAFDLDSYWEGDSASLDYSYDLSSFDTSVSGFDFKPDGKRMYVWGNTNQTMFEFEIEDAWDLNGTVTQTNSNDNSELAIQIRDFIISPDGRYFYACEAAGGVVRQFAFGLYSEGYVTGRRNITQVSATYTATVNDDTIECTANTFTVTLPPAATTGTILFITNTGAGTITVDGDGSETIMGSTTQTVNPNESLSLISNGTQWILRG